MKRALLAVLVAASGCALREPADFGKACANDSECRDKGLVCDPDERRCLLPKPPPNVPGLACKDPLTLALRQTQGLFAGSIRANAAAEPSPTPPDVVCAGDADHWLYIAVDIPTPMSARLRARSANTANKVTVAVLGKACVGSLDHACSAGAADAEITLPFLDEGPLVIAVAGAPGDELEIELSQVNCPPGFLPVDGDARCRGFVPIPGPAPRQGHQLSVLEDGTAIVTGGDDGAGGFLDAEAFDADLRIWSPRAHDEPRTGHAAIARHEHILVAGGNAAVPAEYLEPGAPSFQADFDLEYARGVVGGTLTRVTEDEPFLFIGGEVPMLGAFSDVGGDCSNSSCAPGFTCLSEVVDENDPFGTEGHCVCLRDDCNRLLFDEPLWLTDENAPAGIRFRTRHFALDLALADNVAEILAFGGATPDGLAQPMLFIALTRTWIDLGLNGEVPAPRYDPIGAHVGSSNVLIVGGRDADERPLDLVEIWAPRVGVILASKRLARPRADAVGVIDPESEELVVVGGDDGEQILATSEIVDTVSAATRVGPRLPVALRGARAVALGDDVLVVGGASDDGLVDDAFLLTTIGASLVVPDFGSGPETPDVHLGDTCDDAIPIELPLEGPLTGTVSGNTLNLRDDIDIDFTDQGCTSFGASAGVDIFFTIELPAAAALDVVFTNPDGQVDVVLLAYDSCPVEPPCRTGQDSSAFDAPETIHVDNTSDATETIVIVGDTFLDLGPYSYVLNWTITP